MTAAAAAVLSRFSLPRRTVTVLLGESLLNDALALLLFDAAVASSTAHVEISTLLPRAALAVPGGIVLGIALGKLYLFLSARLAETLGGTLFQFASTFGTWIVAERLRPEGEHDPYGVEQGREKVRQGYGLIAPMIAGPWAMGETFTLADCAALPALFYADYAVNLDAWPGLRAYLDRLKARHSGARVLTEAEPFMQYVPLRNG